MFNDVTVKTESKKSNSMNSQWMLKIWLRASNVTLWLASNVTSPSKWKTWSVLTFYLVNIQTCTEYFFIPISCTTLWLVLTTGLIIVINLLCVKIASKSGQKKTLCASDPATEMLHYSRASNVTFDDRGYGVRRLLLIPILGSQCCLLGTSFEISNYFQKINIHYTITI